MNIREKARAKHQRRHPVKAKVGPQIGTIVNGGGINYAEWLKRARESGLRIELHKGYATLHKMVS